MLEWEVFKIIKIISGIKKGFKINVKNKKQLRPTLSRVRENLFNILQNDIENTIGLDLFAGSGAIGIEALSRGAKKIFFVEKDKEIFKNIKKTLIDAKFLLKSYIFLGSWIDFLKNNKVVFDWIYVDPPHNLKIYENIITLISDMKCLNSSGYIILEINSKEKKLLTKKIKKFFCFKTAKYGNSKILFYKKI